MRPIGPIFFLRAVLFLLPLFFLPVIADSFEFAKLALLVLGGLLALLFWSWGRKGREFTFQVTPIDVGVFGFAAIVLLASFLITPNRGDAFFFPGTATLVLAGTLLYFLVVQVSGHSTSDESKPTSNVSLLTPFLTGGALSALVSFLAGIGFLKLIPGLPVWLVQPTFSTTGGLLPAMTLYLVLLPVAAWGLWKSKGAEIKLFGLNLGKFPISIHYSLFTILLLLGLAAAVFQALPGKPASPRVLPLATGWSVALEVFKKSPILGVGPGNFVEAFSRFRPVEFNQTPVWNLRFATSSNWPLHIFTVTGLLGIVAFVFLLWRLWQLETGNWKLATGKLTPTHYSLLATIILFFIVPANLLLLVAFYLLLGLVASSKAREVKLVLGVKSGASDKRSLALRARDRAQANLIPVLLSLLTITITIFVLYFGGRVFAADMRYKRALDAAARNEGTPAYNELIRAINLNPGRDAYHITYSQVNLALAGALAGKGEITEDDRQTIGQLVQQAIREGKVAVSLNTRRSGNWENLARIYQALIPFAQGADQWTAAAYQQAIALDPVNPLLRIGFGGVYYSLGQYDEAIRVFELAVAAKPDLANAHYNLAAAYREKGDTERAAQAMQRAVNLVERGSQDYQIAQGELDALRGKLVEEREATASGETLEVSETPTEPVLEPPLELPAEAAPPATQSASPIPAPRVSPSPSP